MMGLFSGWKSKSISTERRKVMQAGVHLQLLVGMERKINSSVGRRWRHRWAGRSYLETTISKPPGKLDAGLCLAFSSALTSVDVPSPVSMTTNSFRGMHSSRQKPIPCAQVN